MFPSSPIFNEPSGATDRIPLDEDCGVDSEGDSADTGAGEVVDGDFAEDDIPPARALIRRDIKSVFPSSRLFFSATAKAAWPM